VGLALAAGVPPTMVPMNGVHIQFTHTGNGLVAGQIQGSVKKTDIDTKVVPALAQLLTRQVAANPNSSSTQQLLAIFDTGGDNGMCTNPDGSIAKMGDGKIDTCEVAENSIIKNVLAPDVDIYDANGNYAPNKANTSRDSLSIGVGFTAVPASF
jgi:hypothetical protein